MTTDDSNSTALDVTATELKQEFGRVTDLVVRGERLRVIKHGRAQFALIPLEDLELLEHLEDQMDIEAAEKARAEGGRIPAEELYRRLGL